MIILLVICILNGGKYKYPDTSLIMNIDYTCIMYYVIGYKLN